MMTGPDVTPAGLPPAQGLYDPAHEHDACGVGFVVDIKGRRSHAIVSQALQVLNNLLHRGACGCEANTGDGAGILIQMPHRSCRASAARLGITLPAARPLRRRARLPAARRRAGRERASAPRGHRSREEGPAAAGLAGCPDRRLLRVGATARSVEPRSSPGLHGPRRRHARPGRVRAQALRHPQALRSTRCAAARLAERKFFYVPSLSSNTLIYKGMLSADQIEAMFPDVTDPLVESALALVHQRFCTNTFPSWPLAHPYRYDRPQRRDQHAARQHQLDARARGALPVRPCSARTSRRSCR